MRFANFADEVSEQRASCRVYDEAPHIPISDTSTARGSFGKPQLNPLLLGATYAFRAMGVSPKYPLLILARSRNHQELWGVSSELADCNFWSADVHSNRRGRGVEE